MKLSIEELRKISENIEGKSFYELEEELQMGHYKVVGVPIERNGYVILPTTSSIDIINDYKYIENFIKSKKNEK